MTVHLWDDGRDVASWVLKNPVGGPVDIEIAGVWHLADVTGDIASLRICGAGVIPKPVADVVVVGDVLPRVRQGGVIRSDEWIRVHYRAGGTG